MKMVKKIIEYLCEHPGCNQKYLCREEAKECESQELIGPEIEPGLVLKIKYAHPEMSPKKFVVVVNKLQPFGHHKVYANVEFDLEDGRIKEVCPEYSFSGPEITERIRPEGGYLQITQEELDSLNKSRVRESLLKCKRLYREHPMFEEAKKQGGRK